MEPKNASDLSEARLFTRTVYFNVRLYYLRKNIHVIEDFIYCKLYSNYCHAVILRYLELNPGIFDQVEKCYNAMWHNTYLKKIQNELNEYETLVAFPSDSEMFIYFAKAAILVLVGSCYDTSGVDIYEEKVSKYVKKAIKMRVLCENYDINRIKCKSIVNAVYQWLGIDLAYYANDPDVNHGWEEISLSRKYVDYLNTNGLKLLLDIREIDFCQKNHKFKFLFLLYQVYQGTLGESNIAIDQKSKIILNASLLSLHFIIYCNYVKAPEIVIDALNRYTNM